MMWCCVMLCRVRSDAVPELCHAVVVQYDALMSAYIILLLYDAFVSKRKSGYLQTCIKGRAPLGCDGTQVVGSSTQTLTPPATLF